MRKSHGVIVLAFVLAGAALPVSVAHARPKIVKRKAVITKTQAIRISKKYLQESGHGKEIMFLHPFYVRKTTDVFWHDQLAYDPEIVKKAAVLEERPIWILYYKHRRIWTSAIKLFFRVVIDATNGHPVAFEWGL